ncbi:hypothetical protein C8Q76DRAFT_569741, partial [Earliella scabrosa]
PPFRGGKPPAAKTPTATHYEPHVTKLILTACHHFSVLVCTENPYPDELVQARWAEQTWEAACAGMDLQYKLTDAVLNLIVARTSNARGTLKDIVRTKIVTTYEFSEGTTEDAKAANRARYVRLLDAGNPEPDPVFLYKASRPERWLDARNQWGFAEHKIVKQIIHGRWFSNGPTSLGVMYSSQFSPIRRETLALIFTAIHFCLDQWAEGTQRQGGKFWESMYQARYDGYMKRINDWMALDTEHAKKLLQRLHDDARASSGAAPMSAPVAGLSSAARQRLLAHIATRDRE